MNWILRIICLTAALWLVNTELFATHNRAGEITYEQIGPLTIRITLVTYTKTSSHVDRDSLIVYWGDGTSETIGRINEGGTPLDNDIKRNYYVKEHTYPGRGTYTIGMTDPNRIGGILNVNYPNSIRIKFHITTTFTFLNQQFQGPNNSAILLQPPIDEGCVGKPFVHNPNAYDPDGDSLAYEWAVPLQDVGSPVPNYLFPDQIEAGPDNNITLDEKTGDIVWDSPQRKGSYNIAIRIKEYRNGVLINSIIRDMQIEIHDCNNNPPEVDVAQNVCTVAGELLEIPVHVDDPERETQLVKLTALGGPLEVDVSPAIFANGEEFENVPRTADFIWQTQCDHIRASEYTMVFKAMDNFFSDSSGLADLKTMNIQVVGPPPDPPEVERDLERNIISWTRDDFCHNSPNFQGYTIWRKNGSGIIPDDVCLPNPEKYGYTIVGFVGKDGEYQFIDENIQNGVTYCYRLTARFASLSDANNPYNITESKPSAEVCIKIDRDLPLLTRASVAETDSISGVVELSWIKPHINIDSLQPDGPYSMVLYHSTSVDGDYLPVAGSAVEAETIDDFDSSYSFVHDNINTLSGSNFYKVSLESASRHIGYSSIASTIFLNSDGGDRYVGLKWESLTPWSNIDYVIYRWEDDWIEIGETSNTSYTDRQVTNLEEYCYKVEGKGIFEGIAVEDTTFNFSQEICVIPDDTTPPCRPVLTVENNCQEGKEIFLFTNILQYEFPDSCADDIEDMKVQIEFQEYGESEFKDVTDDPSMFEVNENTSNHSSAEGFAGCYRVRMIDPYGNFGPYSDTLCVEPCPLYRLPNVFTPNGDGRNDVFYPLNRAFIQKVNFEAYSRWGNLVFRTDDPDINWDGTDMEGKPLDPGTYTYRCDLFLDTKNGQILFNSISGTIDLLR